MALTAFQRTVLRLLAEQRRRSGESYVAGAVALNELTRSPRRSRDVDLFHDSQTALRASWDSDRLLLERNGYSVDTVRERSSFVEAVVSQGAEAVVLEWAQDSAFRFFPLVENLELGLTLHPVDLATNKVLALVGRHEARDFVDVIRCDEALQPLGFLAWAAAGKDPGFSPLSIIEEAARSTRYSQQEIDSLDFEGPRPEAAALSRQWHAMVGLARATIEQLPAEHVGECVLDERGELLHITGEQLSDALAADRVHFHRGTLRGSFPTLRAPTQTRAST